MILACFPGERHRAESSIGPESRSDPDRSCSHTQALSAFEDPAVLAPQGTGITGWRAIAVGLIVGLVVGTSIAVAKSGRHFPMRIETKQWRWFVYTPLLARAPGREAERLATSAPLRDAPPTLPLQELLRFAVSSLETAFTGCRRAHCARGLVEGRPRKDHNHCESCIGSGIARLLQGPGHRRRLREPRSHQALGRLVGSGRGPGPHRSPRWPFRLDIYVLEGPPLQSVRPSTNRGGLRSGSHRERSRDVRKGGDVASRAPTRSPSLIDGPPLLKRSLLPPASFI